MSKTCLDITFLCVGSGYDTTAFNPNIPKMTLSYAKNPNDSSDTYCFLEGEAEFEMEQEIPCSQIELTDYFMRATHTSANDSKSPFHCDVSFLRTFQLKNMPLHNSFTVTPVVSSDPTCPCNPLTFSTLNNKIPKKFKIKLRQIQYVDDHSSQQFLSLIHI